MSQKRNQKRRSHRRATELAATVTPTNSQPVPAAVIEPSAEPVADDRAPIAAAAPRTDVSLMRRDLAKVVIVVALVIGVLVALVLTNSSSGWLNRIADQIYQWLKLS